MDLWHRIKSNLDSKIWDKKKIEKFELKLTKLLENSIQTLDLSKKNIGIVGLECLCGVLKLNTSLKCLSLGVNNVGNEGCKILSDVLKINTTIQEINLENNNIGNEGCKYLSEALTSSHCLQILNLEVNNIDEEGCKYLSRALKLNDSLKTLNLENNKIGNEGCKALCEELKVNTSLLVLNLGSNNIGNEGCKYLSESLKVNNSLQRLYIGKNNIGNDGISYLIVTLNNNFSLQGLYLEKNPIADDGAILLSSYFKTNKTLSKLDLRGTNIGVFGAAIFLAIQKYNPRLSELNVLSFLGTELTARKKFEEEHETKLHLLLSIFQHEEMKGRFNFEEFGPSQKLIIFFLSIIYENFKVFEYLLRNGIYINSSSESGNTGLHFSCMCDCYQSTLRLLNYGADPSIINKLGKTCIQVSTGKCKELFETTKQLKVITIGNAGVGKTKLLKKIFNKELSTGEKLKKKLINTMKRKESNKIEMYEWEPHNGKTSSIIRFWDFAGGEAFFTIHQTFLSENSTLFLVFNLTEDLKASKLEFWLNSIQYRAPKSKVFLIGTFLDELDNNLGEEEIKIKANNVRKIISKVLENNPKTLTIEIIECKEWMLDEKTICESIPFWCVSTKKYLGINELKNELINLAFTKTFGKEFVQLTKEIISIRARREEVQTIIEKISSPQEINIKTGQKKSLLDQLSSESPCIQPHDIPRLSISELETRIEKLFGRSISKRKIINQLYELGFILHYNKWESNDVVYDPQWLANLFRCFETLKTKNQIKEGLLEMKDITQAFKEEFPNIKKEDAQTLFKLLETFQIFVNSTKPNLFVIPFLMNEDMPVDINEAWNKSEILTKFKSGRGFIIPFLPLGIISKLICKFNNQEKSFCSVFGFWKYGIFLSWGNSNVLIQCLNSVHLESNSKEEILEQQTIQILSVGEDSLNSLETVEFLILTVFEMECPLLIQKMKRIIYYYNQGKEFVLSYSECLDKLNQKLEIKVNNISISPEALFFTNNNSLHINPANLNFIKGFQLELESYWTIYRCRIQTIPGIYCLKEFDIKVKQEKEKIQKLYQIEEEILKSVSHSHIITIFYSRNEIMSLIIQDYDTTLGFILSDPHFEINDNEKLILCYQISDALKYLHSQFIVHFDLQPRNIFVQFRKLGNLQVKYIKVGNFSQSIKLKHANETICCGKEKNKYVAPEVVECFTHTHLNPISYNPYLADIYSFGVVIYDIKFGIDENKDFNLDEIIPIGMKEQDILITQIIKCCNQKNPSSRPIASELYNHFQKSL